MEYYQSFNDSGTDDVKDLVKYKKVSIFLFGWTLDRLRERLPLMLDKHVGAGLYNLSYDGPDPNRDDAHLFTLKTNLNVKNNREGIKLLESDY